MQEHTRVPWELSHYIPKDGLSPLYPENLKENSANSGEPWVVKLYFVQDWLDQAIDAQQSSKTN
jgi:hypothetical protein